MRKNISSIGWRTACALVMSAILAVTVPADLFGQNGEVFAEGSSGTTCPYGDTTCQDANLNGTHAHNVTIGTGCPQQTISGGTFFKSGSLITITVQSGGTITGGTFGDVTGVVNVIVEGGKISGGTFDSTVTVQKDSSENKGEITGGIFNGSIEVSNGGVISNVTEDDGSGQVSVKSGGTITGGIFSKKLSVEGGTIDGGTFNHADNDVNSGIVKAGIFYGHVTNKGTIEGGTFQRTFKNQDEGTINNGTFYGTVSNAGTINNGTFYETVSNAGTINDGTFYGTVSKEGTINNGTFHGTESNAGTITGASEAVHTHSYSWVTVQEASVGQDGIEEYRCSCGDVQERCVIPASEVFVKGLYGEIKNAPQNGTATFDSGRLYTLSDYVIKKLAERSDVTTIITFEYQKQSYRMTIPAGADYTALLADQDYFYGYFYFANAVGAAIEAL